jgi:hypothetical protein
MIRLTLFFFATFILQPAISQTTLADGEQPVFTVDSKGVIRLVFGKGDQIFYATSSDGGDTFGEPVTVARIEGMHLGMTRGPQLATSKDFSIVTAIDKHGNIHSFKLTHKTDQWKKISNVNDSNASAPEGLMSVSADDKNNFYATWLDLRYDQKNNICFSSLTGTNWSANRFAYKSPESHVCECCKPSIAVKGNTIAIMFRNWLKGSRDLYLITSADMGKTFSNAQKLGAGTWLLKGCPMDGGGLTLDATNQIHTAWQRDGVVYYADPGKEEEKIGEGRGVSLHGNIATWNNGQDLMLKKIGGEVQKIAEGTALKIHEFPDRSILAIWENDDQIVFKKIRS